MLDACCEICLYSKRAQLAKILTNLGFLSILISKV
jgi:hypothetical protein